MKNLWILTLLVFGCFFEGGCSAAQRKEILDEALTTAKTFVVNEGKQLLESAKTFAVDQGKNVLKSATDYVDGKLREKEVAQLALLDQQLAQFASVDPETGTKTVKTWKDFDEDKDGSLGPGELVKAATFIGTQTAKRVASGEMSKDEAGRIAKGTGATIVALLAIFLGKKGLDKLKPAAPAPPVEVKV